MTETTRVSSVVNVPGTGQSVQGVAYCPVGYTVTGGGAQTGLTDSGIIAGSEPTTAGQGWSAWGRASAAQTMTVWAICLRMSS
ncbi:hypothetical protein [Actinomadura sp. KC216]|uniref:hypothetical protein n=1 Tax=Actinomadura sp. KC216 TaxID=2530370 RepID=UPI001FB69362|nr:hypothetical protein [Actinomadura sp. KC216]